MRGAGLAGDRVQPAACRSWKASRMPTAEAAWRMCTAFMIGRECSSCVPVSVGLAAAAWPSMSCTILQRIKRSTGWSCRAAWTRGLAPANWQDGILCASLLHSSGVPAAAAACPCTMLTHQHVWCATPRPALAATPAKVKPDCSKSTASPGRELLRMLHSKLVPIFKHTLAF